MNRNEDERFLEMQEHPENYTHEQLTDPDVQQTLGEMAQLKRAMVRKQQADEAVDVDAAWQEFAAKHIAPARRRMWWSKAAAVVAGFALTGLAYAAAVHFDVAPNIFAPVEHPTAAAEVQDPGHQLQTAAPTASDTISTGVQTVVYDNTDLVDIIEDFSSHYGVQANYADEDLKSIRLFYQWDKSLSIEQNIAILNGFDRFHISLADVVLTIEKGGKEATK